MRTNTQIIFTYKNQRDRGAVMPPWPTFIFSSRGKSSHLGYLYFFSAEETDFSWGGRMREFGIIFTL